MTGTSDRQERKARRARADLDRMTQQSEKLLGAGSGAGASEKDDPIEIWGRRIGRTLGFAFAGYLIWHLLTTYILK